MKNSIQFTVVVLASIASLTQCQGPTKVPSCCDLKKMEPSVECDVDCNVASSGLLRSFGSASFGFGGGNFIGGFHGKFIFDVRCNQWRSVGPRECPVAYDMDSYSNFCQDFRLTTHLGHNDVRPVYVLDLFEGGFETCQYTPVCLACPGLGLCDVSFDSHGGSQIFSSQGFPLESSHLGHNQLGGNLWLNFLPRTRSGRSVDNDEVVGEDEENDEESEENDEESECDSDDSDCLLEKTDADYDADFDDEHRHADDRGSRRRPPPSFRNCCPCTCCGRWNGCRGCQLCSTICRRCNRG